LSLFFGLVAIVVLSGFGFFIERSIELHFNMDDDTELGNIDQTAYQLLAKLGGINNIETIAQRLEDILVGHHGAVLYLTAPNARVLFASHHKPDLSTISRAAPVRQNQISYYRWNDAGHAYRVLTHFLTFSTTGTSETYTLSIAVSMDHHLRFLADFRSTLWLMIGTAIVIMSLMGWLAVRRGHVPLHAIVAKIRHISATELNTRLQPESVPRELINLVKAFNEMMEHMEEAFERLSNFSADIAHELRTPVTNLLTQTQVALSKSRNEVEYREILYSNIEEYERMAQMVSDMLFLAKADNGQYQVEKQHLDIAKEVHELFEYFEAWAEDRGVSLEAEGSADITGDRLMLRRGLGNIIANAINHTPSGHAVTILLSQDVNQTAYISIENHGLAIPAQHIPRLFDRFYRVDPSRQRGSEGAGLGLAIAKSIMDIHGGKIEVTSTDKCTRFRITLPRTP